MAEKTSKPAVVGEYTLFSVLAFVLGFSFWPAGIVLGVIALSELKEHPELKGRAFAWIGVLFAPILLVTIFTLVFGAQFLFWIPFFMFGFDQ